MPNVSTARQSLLDVALNSFNQVGYEATTVAAICQFSGVSNGSFFHHFGSKEGLAGAIFLAALRSYHAALIAELSNCPTAPDGIAKLITAHLRWVGSHRAQAHFMFEQTRPEWLAPIQVEQQTENMRFATEIEAWRQPLIHTGKLEDAPALAFFSQVIGPAQLLCRVWLSSPDASDLNQHIEFLTRHAIRALSTQPKTAKKRTKT
jgi:AcrR family transcriptional regulator